MTGLATTAAHDGQRAAPRPRLWRVTDRATFAELRRDGRRGRSGAVAVTWLPAEGAAGAASNPRAAFAVGRSVGGAVVRNRVKRRLRAALRELLAQDRLPRGTYLLSGRPQVAEMAWSDLLAAVDDAVQTAAGRR